MCGTAQKGLSRISILVLNHHEGRLMEDERKGDSIMKIILICPQLPDWEKTSFFRYSINNDADKRKTPGKE